MSSPPAPCPSFARIAGVKTIVVKVGSSTVADDHLHLRRRLLAGLAGDVADLVHGGRRVVLVSSGAIACGQNVLGVAERPRLVPALQAASAVGQGRLFAHYERLFEDHELIAAQVLLTSDDFARRTSYVNARNTLRRLLGWGVVPVVNENDTTATDEITFGDNDFLAAQVALLLDARLLVLLTNIDGLHSADPALDAEAELIAEVGDFSELDSLAIGDRTSAFGSGGMRSKVAAAEMASEAGIPAVICNGTKPGTLAAAASGGAGGTRFAAQEGRESSFKLWLKYAKPTRGCLLVDAGAARVLRESGSSLLPVGVAEVAGSFEAGDAVEVASDGEAIGKGISDYSSRELNQVIGMKTNAVRDVLPHAADEVIHRDRFVLV